MRRLHGIAWALAVAAVSAAGVLRHVPTGWLLMGGAAMLVGAGFGAWHSTRRGQAVLALPFLLSLGLVWLADPSPSSALEVLAVLMAMAVIVAAFHVLALGRAQRVSDNSVFQAAAGRIWTITLLAASAVWLLWWLPTQSARFVSPRWAASLDATTFAYLAGWVIFTLAVGTAFTLLRLGIIRNPGADHEQDA